MASRVFEGPGAGELRHPIVLETRSLTPSGADDLTEGFTRELGAFAKVRALQGGRLVNGVQAEERVTHLFLCRWHPSFRDWTWVRFDNRRFRIRSARDPDERRRWVELQAEEVMNA